MNKKLLVVAIAAALAPVAAMADSGNVTIYGQVNASVDSVDSGYSNNAINGHVAGQRTTQINDNQSRLGFKGTEALGNGLSAVWQLEGAFSADGAANNVSGQNASTITPGGSSYSAATIGSRNTFVGLTGGFGTAILGRHDTPYKLATRSLDVFADNIADNRSLMGQSGNGVTTFDGRQSNVIAYISPSASGFMGAIAYVAGAEGALTSGQKKGDAWSAMGTYANGPIFGSLAYEKHNVGSASTGTLDPYQLAAPYADAGFNGALEGLNEKAWKLGVGYNMGDFKIGLAYEKTSDNFGSGPLGTVLTTSLGNSVSSDVFGHHSIYLGGAYTMGANVIKAAYTKVGDLNVGSSTGAKQYSLGFDHNMSKRTTVYALYTKLNNDDYGVYGLAGGANGGVANAIVTAYTNLPSISSKAFGQDPSAFSVGIKHSF